jgi:hypothetical protein
MKHARGKRRLKWNPDWPFALPRVSAHDNLRACKQGARTADIAFGAGAVLALALAAFHSALGF